MQPPELSRLVRSVVKECEADEVSAALAGAVDAGMLQVEGEHGAFIPQNVSAAASGNDCTFASWAEEGFVPFRVKKSASPPEQRRALGIIFRLLGRYPELRAVPVWISGQWLFSLYLPDGVDLRARSQASYEDASHVHDICLTSLRRFADCDETIRTTLKMSGCVEPPRFPVSKRYRLALTDLAAAIGPAHHPNLPTHVPELVGAGPWTLFCDPKPANFLVRSSQQDAGNKIGQPFRIDLDLLCYQCPLSLQIILAVFSHPVGFERPGTLDDQVSDLRNLCRRWAREFGIGWDEMDAMLLYHLIRNFATAAGQSGQDAARKAMSLAPILISVLQMLTCAGVASDTISGLRRWLDMRTHS